MATKQHTQHSVGAAVRKAAKQAGVGVTVKVSRKSTEVLVSAMYRWDCERNQSKELGERISDWLRANVPADALATGFVKVEINNSYIILYNTCNKIVTMLHLFEEKILKQDYKR